MFCHTDLFEVKFFKYNIDWYFVLVDYNVLLFLKDNLFVNSCIENEQ